MRGPIQRRTGGIEAQRGHPHSNPAAYPAWRETRQHRTSREMDAQRLGNFYDFRLVFPAAYPASIRWQHFTGFLPHQHVNAAHRSPPQVTF